MSSFIRCLFGPRVYRIYRSGAREGREYEGNAFEHYSDNLLKTTLFSLSMAWSLSLYTSPIIASFMYKKGYFTPEGLYHICRLSGTIGILLFMTVFIRGIGRMMSIDYLTFIRILDAYKLNMSQSFKYEMAQYDFDFQEWPIDFRWNDTSEDVSKPRCYIDKQLARSSGVLEIAKGLPCSAMSFFAMHTFGRMMIYPGSVGLLNLVLFPMLLKGRQKLVEEHKGERFKLLTQDGNEIDSMFIDRRHKSHFSNGNILVVCCEGNAGFYEYGITLTPLEAGYSVLGWNHPGFASSTGTPYPDQELKAIDVVMQFAIHKLKFKLQNIVIYAWSIGGFSATWAAMNYPDIKGLVLDATFDDLVALATIRMPPSWKNLVVRTIRDYMDLNNAEQLNKYSGPVLLIRRSRDEIIATHPSRSTETNRGNDLLVKLLTARYPKLLTDDTSWILREWLSGDKNHQSMIWTEHGVEDEYCQAFITSYVEENSSGFPIHIGDSLSTGMKIKLLIFLADKHMIDFDSTHCVQLPARMFRLPWDVAHATKNEGERDVRSCL